MKTAYFKKFEEKINHTLNLHPQIVKGLKQFPANIHDLSHVIFFGPPGSGKYTLSLKLINRYTNSLRYEKKITTDNYVLKISDIHYEIDMALLGCTSKALWQDIFIQVVDSISVKKDKAGIILCKNFHEISRELLEIFYAYLHDLNNTIMYGICIKYIILTDQISFLPSNILDVCNVVNVSHPTKAAVGRCFKHSKIINEDNILSFDLPLVSHIFICDKIIDYLKTTNPIKISKLREHIYELLTSNVNITDALWYIFSKLEFRSMPNTLKSVYQFFRYFNNNYRPIFHIELILIKFNKEQRSSL
jgi:hypothetical protein